MNHTKAEDVCLSLNLTHTHAHVEEYVPIKCFSLAKTSVICQQQTRTTMEAIGTYTSVETLLKLLVQLVFDEILVKQRERHSWNSSSTSHFFPLQLVCNVTVPFMARLSQNKVDTFVITKTLWNTASWFLPAIHDFLSIPKGPLVFRLSSWMIISLS